MNPLTIESPCRFWQGLLWVKMWYKSFTYICNFTLHRKKIKEAKILKTRMI